VNAYSQLAASSVTGACRTVAASSVKLSNGIACVAKPDTILARYRRLIAAKFDGWKQRRQRDRP